MRLFQPTLAATALAATALAASSAQAQFTQYTDLASFTSAAGATVVTDFNSTPAQILGGPGDAAFSTTVTGINIAGSPNGDYIAIASGSTAGNFDGTNFLYFSQANPENGSYSGNGNLGPSFTLNFSGPLTALGFNWTDTDPTDAYQITINGSTFTTPPFNLRGTGSGFFGVVADPGTTLRSITFTQNAAGGIVDPFGIDNIRVNTTAVNPVPEPSEWLAMGMAGTSLFGLMIRARKRRAGKNATWIVTD